MTKIHGVPLKHTMHVKIYQVYLLGSQSGSVLLYPSHSCLRTRHGMDVYLWLKCLVLPNIHLIGDPFCLQCLLYIELVCLQWYSYLWLLCMANVGNYVNIPYMEHMGMVTRVFYRFFPSTLLLRRHTPLCILSKT